MSRKQQEEYKTLNFVFKIDAPPALNSADLTEKLNERRKINAAQRKILLAANSRSKSRSKKNKKKGGSKRKESSKEEERPKRATNEISNFLTNFSGFLNREKCPNCEKRMANRSCVNQSCRECCKLIGLPCKFPYHNPEKIVIKKEKETSDDAAGKRKREETIDLSSPKKTKPNGLAVRYSPSKNMKQMKAAALAKRAFSTLQKAAQREPRISDEDLLKAYSVSNIKDYPIRDVFLAGKLIEGLYTDLFDGFKIPKEEVYATDGTCMKELLGFGSATYGEVSFRSIPTLCQLLDIKSSDVFYDLGSGLGKCVIQVAAQFKCKQSIGIESAKSRWQASEIAKQRFEKFLDTEMPKLIGRELAATERPEVKFLLENILEVDFSDATVVLWNNVCFPVDTCKKVVEKLAKLKTGTKIVTMRKLCGDRHGVACALKQLPCLNFHLLKHDKLYCTWTKDCTAYLYERI